MSRTSTNQGVIAAAFGALTGMAAGFIGVGGGELRMPVLVSLLAFPFRLAGGVNLLVGLFTVGLSTLRRWEQDSLTHDGLVLVGIMGIVSMAGATIGVYGRGRLPVRPLRIIICLYLLVMGCWMLYESFARVEHVLLEPSGVLRWTLASVIGFAIALASGVLGVAGGEMRIPALMYLFGVPIVEAGTLSLAVSVPTVIAAAFTDRRLGGLPNAVMQIALLMGLASAVGVLVGAALLPYANHEVIKGAFGTFLLLATIRLATVPSH